ncbi:MAG: hypothetical protein NTW86_10355 [Candidatus Sumerlaeota bacterium]|nr:hypothetical protein [Candidatus Sumerlaeota bacterium]
MFWCEDPKVLRCFSVEGSLNCSVRDVDLDKPDSAANGNLWTQAGQPALPCLLLFYPPEAGVDAPAWTGPLSAESVAALADSPARREIAKRLLGGDSAVWVLTASGGAEKDEAAKTLLETQVKDMEQTLELPEGAEDALAAELGGYDVSSLPLKIQFSVLSVARNDPAEAVLMATLTQGQSGLEKYAGEPVAYPVFGQGRALCALVGKGLNEDNIGEASALLAGPCSCEFKDSNPGVDLLIAARWDEGQVDAPRGLLALPPISASVPKVVEVAKAGAPSGAATVSQADPPASAQAWSGRFPVRIVAALAAALALVAGAAGLILRRLFRESS